MTPWVLVAVLALLLLVVGYLWSGADSDAFLMRCERDSLASRVAVMREREARERAAGNALAAKHRAQTQRLEAVLGEARAWRKRAIARGWMKGDP